MLVGGHQSLMDPFRSQLDALKRLVDATLSELALSPVSSVSPDSLVLRRPSVLMVSMQPFVIFRIRELIFQTMYTGS